MRKFISTILIFMSILAAMAHAQDQDYHDEEDYTVELPPSNYTPSENQTTPLDTSNLTVPDTPQN